MRKRKKIPKATQDIIRAKQLNRCLCCPQKGKVFHHVIPFSLGGEDHSKNVVLLCEKHHDLLHLGDLDTLKTVSEYYVYTNKGEMPHNVDFEAVDLSTRF